METPDPIAAMIDGFVQSGDIAGAVTLVWREDRMVHAAATGFSDVASATPLQRDSIFRIASLSKPVTAAATMSLWEDGLFQLDDPISKVAPEFENMRVLRTPASAPDDTIPATRQITFDDLLTHRSGLTYGSLHAGPLADAFAKALGGDIDTDVPADIWINNLATLPLLVQPGSGFCYGHSSDLLGLLIARIEGATVGEVLRRRIFDKLGMADTFFTVPPEKHGRRAGMYGFDDAAKLKRLIVAPGGATMAERPPGLTYESGGQGLWSTADDYMRFARLFIGGGEVDGVRVLKPETIRLMTSNHLPDDQRRAAQMFGMPTFGEGHGFGFGLATVIDPVHAQVMRGHGGIGTVSWPGAYGGWWQADPTDNSAMVFLVHNMMELEQMAQGIGLGVYGAIMQFHAMGAAR
jgi:CubicO group peptidase (beta-lactamase class C family)